jgi:glutaryl-CoA dehydrogenase (non-decarboxylating)
MQSYARREGDRYILNGEKIWISLAEVADQYLVVAWTDLEKKARRDHSGMSAFIVEREREGVKPYTLHGKLGVRAGNTGGVVFENVEIPPRTVSVRRAKASKSPCSRWIRVATPSLRAPRD